MMIAHMDIYWRLAELERNQHLALLLRQAEFNHSAAPVRRGRLLAALTRHATPRQVSDAAGLEWRERPLRTELRMLLRTGGVSQR